MKAYINKKWKPNTDYRPTTMESNTAVSNFGLRCLKSRARGCARVYIYNTSMKRASVRKDKLKIKGKTGNAQRERKNEEKNKKTKKQKGKTVRAALFC